MIVFCTFIRDLRVVTEYLALLSADKADASSLLALLLSHLQAIGVDLRRISGISTDGAAVMMGSKSGLLDMSTIHASVSRVTSLLESRYVDCGDDFNGGPKDLLTAFLARHGPGGTRSVTVKGVDSDGRPSRFTFDLHEEPLDGYPGEGKHDDCVVACMALAEGMVQNLDERLGDLKQLGGSMLFCADQWPKGWERAPRKAQCLEWFGMMVDLYHAGEAEEILPGINKRAAVLEIPHFCPVLAALPKGDKGFYTGLMTMLKSPDWEDSFPNLVKLWCATAVLPLSTVECERGFSRQNVIKSWLRGSMKDSRIGDLMCMSLLDYDPDWDAIIDIWRAYKKRKPYSTAPQSRAQKSRKGKEKEDDSPVVHDSVQAEEDA
ncbi:hypothetical protein CLOM_g21818 [Closterium sp. NIES-68]|nr:hypothetical protein CLOM_g21818 [Closterium sp. NIES-68]GJP84290.1 hypothetical protein CLOP_g14353 [Closterium sp. NIES-67]